MPFLLALAIVLGVSVCLQGTVNGQLSGRIGLPQALALNSGIVFAGSLVWWLIARAGGGAPSARVAAPWYLYSGGVWGLLIISCAAVAYPRLGAATTTTLAIAGQIVTAIVLDQLGATGRHLPLTTVRLAGVLLVALGTWLVVASSSKS